MKILQCKTMLAILLAIAFTSCKKEVGPNTVTGNDDAIQSSAANQGKPVPSYTRIKTKMIGSTVYSYSYNGSGDVTKEKYGNDSVVFTYPDNTHITEVASANADYNYVLNSKGLVVTTNASYGTITTSYYNAKKQLIETIAQDNGIVSDSKYTYVNGNLDKLEFYYNGVLSTTYKYTYYLDKANVLNNDVFGKPWLGVGSKNLLKSIEVTNAGVTGVIAYTYMFDPVGRVTAAHLTANGNPYQDIVYTY